MNSRIYLQPDAVPTQDMIRTANRLFRYFGKEVTFLQKLAPHLPDITMNRLRWALINDLSADPEKLISEALLKAPNLVVDFADFAGDETAALTSFQEIFEKEKELPNLVLIKKSEEILELAKEDQSKAKRKA